MADAVQNNGGTTSPGGVTGAGFRPGVSGNPGGRPAGLARRIRDEVGADGDELVAIMVEIAREASSPRDRMTAVMWLAERGWGKARTVAASEIDVLEIPMFDPDKLSTEELELIVMCMEKARPDS